MRILYATLFVIAALVFGTGTARADPLDDYVTANEETICHIIDRDGTTLTVFGNLSAAIQVDGGYTEYESGRIIGRAVRNYCPWNYQPLADLMKKDQLA